MRYLALVVGIAMIAIGVIVEIGPFLAFGGPGSFTCGDARACDFLGPLPFFFGGGVVLIGVGIFVLVVAASAFALRSATGTAERWSRLVRRDRFGSHTHDGSTSATTWHVTSSGEHQIPNELAPMIDAC
ncbi:MAG: hypothetical protein H0W07_08650 [Chloroflexi bacterium]|nr:hypothetical protein [Chloroflexota bacterium]